MPSVDIQWVPVASLAKVKRPGREADKWSLFETGLKKASIYTSSPPYAFLAWYLKTISPSQFALLLLG